MPGNTSVRYNWTDDEKAEFCRLYVEENFSVQDIADTHGVSRETVRYHLKKRGVTLRSVGCLTERAKDKQRRENHHSWQGGRYRHASGYVFALARGHPFAHGNYVPEHRLVMERHLQSTSPDHDALVGGYLSKDWVVHHKNGQKDDNQIDNLEPLPRAQHHSWLHFQEEMERLRALVSKHGLE